MDVMRRLVGALALSLGVGALGAAAVWGALALFYLAPGPELSRTAVAGVFAALGLTVATSVARRRTSLPASIAFALALALAVLLWACTKPSNDRDWAPDVALLPYATIAGDRVTMHNVRNFAYRSETEFTPAYDDRTFELGRLDRIDLVAAYWMGPAIAHLFVSFGFGDEHLAISIETRRERGEEYSTLAGFFRQYELHYVVADERDVIRLRTNHRRTPPEDVYLFRVDAPLDAGRRLFLDYVREINALRERPRFYNTLTTNCTTAILAHSMVNPGHPPLSWKILLSGHAPRYLHELGRLDASFSFEELARRAHVNAAARAAGTSPDFSRRIRAGTP